MAIKPKIKIYMRDIKTIDPKEEIERLKTDSYTILSNESIPSEAIIYGSLGVLASGYQGITAWRQLRNSVPINEITSSSSKNLTKV